MKTVPMYRVSAREEVGESLYALWPETRETHFDLEKTHLFDMTVLADAAMSHLEYPSRYKPMLYVSTHCVQLSHRHTDIFIQKVKTFSHEKSYSVL